VIEFDATGLRGISRTRGRKRGTPP